VQKAGPVILEPIMRLEVSAPEEYFGVVTNDLNARRALIQDTELHGENRVIQAHAPLAEMFQYATKLRTLTQGRATWSMEPLAYGPMPPVQQKELLRRYGLRRLRHLGQAGLTPGDGVLRPRRRAVEGAPQSCAMFSGAISESPVRGASRPQSGVCVARVVP
jgi:hypothetical protein